MFAPDRQTTVDAPLALFAIGDAVLLNQVFDNLISNAAKFGEKGGLIEMALGARAGQAVFTIANTGRPIPQQDHAKVCDRFYRADKSRSREIEGSRPGPEPGARNRTRTRRRFDFGAQRRADDSVCVHTPVGKS